jgi:hypothetical protein
MLAAAADAVADVEHRAHQAIGAGLLPAEIFPQRYHAQSPPGGFLKGIAHCWRRRIKVCDRPADQYVKRFSNARASFKPAISKIK